MDLITIYENVPPWDWPQGISEIISSVLADDSVDVTKRMVAAEMAGDLVVFDESLGRNLMAIIENSQEPIDLRCRAAVSFGPAFEHTYIYDFDDPDDTYFSEKVFSEFQTRFEKVYRQAGVPDEVRRCLLEASVRAPLAWHPPEVAVAAISTDKNWRLTAVFCMRFIRGFDKQILEALESGDDEMYYEALLAAGSWGVLEAWPYVHRVLSQEAPEKMMLLAAIEATAGLNHPDGPDSVMKYIDSEDEEIADAVFEAMAFIGFEDYGDDLDDDFDEEDE